jgi:cyclomaltodextrinase
LVLLSIQGVACRPAVDARPTHEASRLELLSADADVWSYEVRVRGVLHGPDRPKTCRFSVRGREQPARLHGRRFEATLTLERGVNPVTATCHTVHGRTLRTEVVRYTVRLLDPPPARAATEAPPPWLPQTVVYGVIPPLFGDPPLEAVTLALDGLAALGVSALWLSPIFDAPPDDYGYAVVDPFKVRPEYGSEEDLRRLVEAAHARDMRVLLDLVPNHTSDRHPYYRQAEALGTRSHYYDFYARDSEGRATHYFDWHNLPNLNYDHPEVDRYTETAALYWVRSADIDGYRVDVAWGVRERDPAFWRPFANLLKREKPALMLLAEASARDPYYLAHGFDAAYDWTDALGEHAWTDVFAARDGIARRLHAAVMASGPALERVFRFLNSNDSGERFITRHGEPLTKVATAALLTLPGIPCVYAFDEVGAEFLPYGELTPITREHPELRTFHARFIHLRRAHPALHAGRFVPLHIGNDDEAYVFARIDERTNSAALVALNFADAPVTVEVELPEALRTRRLEDALGAAKVRAKGARLSLPLAPYESRVLLAR